MSKPFRRVLLHVGPPKTGTTSIQHFLTSNQSALWRRGIYVPSAMRRGAQHIELPLLFGSNPGGLERLAGANIGTIDERQARAINDFAAEIAGVGGGDTLLMSSEHLFSADRTAIDAYKRFFASYTDQLESLMYLRRQDRWIASSVLQKRKTGARGDTDLHAGSPHVFEESVRVWDEGSDLCHIRRFDTRFLRQNSLLEDFCDVIGCDSAGLATEEVYNRAVLQEQLELVDALNHALAGLPFVKQIPYRSRFLPLCTDVLGGSPFEFARAAAKSAFKEYAPVNTWLRETRDPGGPAFFFDDDFTEYPIEARNDRSYTPEQLLELSTTITERFRERDFKIPPVPLGAARADLVAHIVSCFVTLHDSETEHARANRRAAAIEERRRGRSP